MKKLRSLRDVLPKCFKDKDYFYTPSWEELVNSFECEILITKSLGSYQGDYLFLLRDGDLYGFLEFAYGSCSGCDSLSGEQEAGTNDQRNHLWNSIQWKNVADLLKWLKERNWEDHYYYNEGGKEFLDDSIKLLESQAPLDDLQPDEFFKA